MTRNPFARRLVCGVLALGLAGALGLSAQRAHACSYVAGGPPGAALSPVDGARLGAADAFLLTGEREPWLETPTGEPSPLGLVRRFERLQNVFAPGHALFRPSAALVPEQHYALHVSDSAIVHFFVQAETPRRSLELELHVALQEIPEHRLSGAECYMGSLVDRPFTQLAKIGIDYAAPAPLVLSVIAHDESSGQDFEDSAFDGDSIPEPSAGISLWYPLPEGVSPCFHVAVLDFSGASLFDEPELCVTTAGTSRTFTADVLDTNQPAPSAMQPAPSGDVNRPMKAASSGDVERTSAGCTLANASGSPPPLVGAAIAVGLLLVRRRRLLAALSEPVSPSTRSGRFGAPVVDDHARLAAMPRGA